MCGNGAYTFTRRECTWYMEAIGYAAKTLVDPVCKLNTHASAVFDIDHLDARWKADSGCPTRAHGIRCSRVARFHQSSEGFLVNVMCASKDDDFQRG